jgi:hypothetical protein
MLYVHNDCNTALRKKINVSISRPPINKQSEEKIEIFWKSEQIDQSHFPQSLLHLVGKLFAISLQSDHRTSPDL